MNNALSHLSTQQLRRAIGIREKIDALEAELNQVLSGSPKPAAPSATAPAPKTRPRAGKRKLSPAARAKIADAAKARWARFRKDQGGETAAATTVATPAASAPKRRKLSPAARAKIAAAAKARWARVRAGQGK